MLEWFTADELAIMANVSHDRNRDNGALLVCRYTPPKSLPSRSHTEEDKVNSITFRNGTETIVQAVPEPGSTTEGLIGIGRARCSPKDVYNADIGQRVALARAMHDLADRVDAEAQSLIVTWKQLDEIAREKDHITMQATPIYGERPPDPGEHPEIINDAPQAIEHNISVSDEELRILMSIRARKERDAAK